jgi:hypothetical protein
MCVFVIIWVARKLQEKRDGKLNIINKINVEHHQKYGRQIKKETRCTQP